MGRFAVKVFIWAGILSFTLGASALFLYAYTTQRRWDPAKARKHDFPQPVRTALVSEKEITDPIGATATTLASQTGAIQVGSFQLNAANQQDRPELKVKAVHVYEGDYVRQGQLLFELEDELFRTNVKQRELALAGTEAELKRTREGIVYNEKLRQLDVTSNESNVKYRTDDLDAQKRKLLTLEQLNIKNKTSSTFELFDQRSVYLLAIYNLKLAEHDLQRAVVGIPFLRLKDAESLAYAIAKVDAAKVDLTQARSDLARMQFRSPVDGIVSAHTIVAGQTLLENATLTQVLKLDPMFVQMDFPQERLDDIKLGQEVEIVLDSFPKETFTGTVIRIPPQVSTQLRTLPIKISLKNPDNRIRAGISGFARVKVTRKGLVLPATALIEQGSKSMVMRMEDGKPRVREIRTRHATETGEVEVRAGLAAGDEVVIYHNFYFSAGHIEERGAYLKDGDAVDTDWRKWARRE